MKTVQISLNSIDKVKSFVNDITKFDYDFDLVSGRYVIDAKSIMGIFSLDLSKPIDLNIHAEGNTEEVLEVLKPYMIYSESSTIIILMIGNVSEKLLRRSFSLFYNDYLVCFQCSLHQLLNLFIQILLMSANHIEIRLGHGMLGHKNGTAILKGLDGSFIGADFLRYLHDLLLVKTN